MTGQLSVDLDFFPNASEALAGIDDGVLEVPSIPSDLQHLKDQLREMNLPDLSEKARAGLASMQLALDELRVQIVPLATVVAALADTVGQLADGIAVATRKTLPATAFHRTTP